MRVRFQEVDGLRMVWHGHYLSYFEEGRLAFGRRYGLSYQDVFDQGFVVPLVHLDVDYFAPATYDDVLTVRTRLHPEPAARLTFTYLITNQAGTKLATGRTTQAFTDAQGVLILTRPEFYEEFLAEWASSIREE